MVIRVSVVDCLCYSLNANLVVVFLFLCHVNTYLIKNSQAVKKGAAPKKAMVKKDVKSKVVAKKWL